MTTAPTLRMVHPATLILDAAVRLDSHVDGPLVAAVRRHGITSPITGHTDASGAIHVRAGQRRTLAAIEAGLSVVPVLVWAADSETKGG